MESQYWIPSVMRNDAHFDIYSSMLAQGIILVNAPIDQRISGLITACLLHVNETSNLVKPRLYLNTKRGDVISAMAVVDVMQFLKVKIETVGFGEIGVAAALILAAGTKGQRKALAHSSLTLYLGGDSLKFEAIQGEQAKAKEERKVRQRTMELFVQFTGLDMETIRDFANREGFFEAAEAKRFGFIDETV